LAVVLRHGILRRTAISGVLAMPAARVKLCEGGRVVIPAEVRKQLGLKVGDHLLLRVENNELRMYSRLEGMRRAREILRKYVPEGVSLVDELIAERRAEAERE
jgi:AbrB family looped-hinge helix DNA binding protein